MSTAASALAQLLIDHVRAQGVLDLDVLTRDPLQALAADRSVTVSWVDSAMLPPGCSIAATYNASTTPAQIVVAEDAAPGRRRFSLLHEYGHHLRNQVVPVIAALFAAKGQAAALEEKVCDAFASFILIPAFVRGEAFRDGVTASAVLDLIASSSASEQAVAVAAAESMHAPGYVLLLNVDGEIEFAGRSGDVFPIRRGAPQPGFIARAAASGSARQGIAALNQGGGVVSAELNIDVASRLDRVVAVAVDGPAPWQRFSAGRAAYAKPLEGWCEECARGFETFATCALCDDPKCPDCGLCGCGTKPLAGERVCQGCFLVLPPAAYAASTATFCRDCR